MKTMNTDVPRPAPTANDAGKTGHGRVCSRSSVLVRVLTFVVIMIVFTAIVAAVFFHFMRTGKTGDKAPSSLNSSNNNLVQGGWVLSRSWWGYMGVAILFEGDKFNYWFYSDVITGDEPQYPISGNYKVEGSKVVLTAENNHLYSDTWHLFESTDGKCLMPDQEYRRWQETGEYDDSRLLHYDKDFVPGDPFRYQFCGLEILDE